MASSPRRLREELAAHLEDLVREYRAQGLPEAEARRAARLKLGGLDQIEEAWRDQRGWRWAGTAGRDARLALRGLRRAPGFTAAALLTLALGIGANAAIFSLAYQALLRPLAFPVAGQLVSLFSVAPATGVLKPTGPSTSYLTILDWRAQNRVFTGLAAYRNSEATLAGVGEATLLEGAAATPSLFSTLGVRPLLGTAFTWDQVQRGAPVVMISERLWRGRLGADPAIIGRGLELSGQVFTVVGVMPAGFRFPFAEDGQDFWLPATQDPNFRDLMPRRGGHFMAAVARLRPGVSVEQAQTEMAGLSARLARAYPKELGGWTTLVRPLRDVVVGDARAPMLLLLAAGVLVLLIVCVNLATLLLARATSRRRELALCAALGASRGRLAGRQMVESLVLSALGGGLALVVAQPVERALGFLLPSGLAPPSGAYDAAFGFALAAAVIVGLAASVPPTLISVRAGLAPALKSGSATAVGGRHGGRSALVVAELALSTVLLIGAGLLLRSYSRLVATPLGFQPARVLFTQIGLPKAEYTTPAQWTRFYDRALAAVRGLPGVHAAALCLDLPLTGGTANLGFAIAGQPAQPGGQGPSADDNPISPDYFQAVGIPLLRGRNFSAADTAASPAVAIVNQAFVHAFFPGQDPLGQRLVFGYQNSQPRAIVGVVGDTKVTTVGEAPTPMMHTPYPQDPWWFSMLVVNVSMEPGALVAPVRAALGRLDPNLPLAPTPLSQLLRQSLAATRDQALLLILLAAVALVLALTGVYGVMSYSVSQRQRELGLRLAMGASPAGLLALIGRETVALAALGAGLGLAAAFIFARFLAGLLYQTSPEDPLTFIAVGLGLMATALIAALAPARRAARIDPMIALRQE